MNSLQIMLNHRQLVDFTEQDYLKLQERVASNHSYILEGYIIQKKLSSTQWTSFYHALNSKTQTYHFIKIYHINRLVEEERQSEVTKLRRFSRNIMKMNPEHVMKCYECFENDDLFIIVMESSKQEGTLKDVLKEGIRIDQPIAVQWIKQIICGLTELYKQNIYLPEIRLQKICLIEDRCKLNDFKNIEKKLTLTEADLVKKHIFQLGKIFLCILNQISDSKEKDLDNPEQIMEEIDQKAKLSKLAMDFLKKSLSLTKQNFTSWQQVINHKLFNDETRNSSNIKFLNLSRVQPQVPFKKRQSTLSISASTLKQLQSALQSQEQWDCQQYIQIQKTKLILDKIIHDIDEDKVLDITEREVIEILYLMAVRCLNNFNQINRDKEKLANSELFAKKIDLISKMEKQVSKTFYRFSSLLTEKQNEKLQISKDWINMAKSVVKFQFFESKRRNKFLTGIQSTQDHQHDYTKQEQIDFTQELIANFLKNCQFNSDQRDHVFYFLLNYKKIMDIRMEDLDWLTFEQKVKEILRNVQTKVS